ncbi:MAG: TonB family protein [Bacteroidetes bacterium]|uniref:TonB family protein n=1 Tax=Candidatus Cryptobacteroides merdigallinarum TaxID=2840770 RepID=A0A9D9EIE5_9BACT|nr:TonB family protein [Candidatus Cryptobacteroides merdigallinarum]
MDIRISAAMLLTAFSCLAANAQYAGPDDAYSGLYDSETVSSFKKHVSYITSASFEGRKAGSEGEKAVAVYVYDRLKEYGVEMLTPRDGEVFGISRTPGDTLASRNVYGFIQGYDPSLKDKYIVVGARMDNLGTNVMTVDGRQVTQIYAGANGNASGVAMMLELARMVSTNSLIFRRSVIFIGFGASSETFAGAWYFLNRSFSDSGLIEAMVNLDMLGTGNEGFYAYTASNTDLNSMISTLSGKLQPVYPELRSDELYPSDHRAFYSKEIPAVHFTTGRYPEHNTPRDTYSIIDFGMMERELEYVYNFVLELANTDRDLAFRNEPVAEKKDRTSEGVVAYYDCDQRPMFLNSADPRQFLEKWVYQYLRYPPEAVENGIQGTVQVNFVIDKDGKVRDVKVAKSVDPLLDEEAVRVVSASPKWRPGRLRGEKVSTSMTIPVEFRLARKTDRKRFGIR